MSLKRQRTRAARERTDKSVDRSAPPRPRAHHVRLGALVLIVMAIVVATHWPVLSAGALSFDDRYYLTDNYVVRNPSWASGRRFLSEVFEPSTVPGYYQPLAMISLMLDYAQARTAEDLRCFHRTALAVHALNVGLLIVLLYLLIGEPWSAAAAGLLFGVHPMTVEPVAWVGERKTLLATFFALGCLILYVRYARRGSWGVYAACLGTFVLALLSKPTVTPLPILLLLLDAWPLRRLNRRAVLEKAPFFAIAGVFALVTIVSQGKTSEMVLPSGYPPSRVPLLACHNLVFYPAKMLWPSPLSSIYPFPKTLSFSEPMVLAGVVGTAGIVAALLVSLRWTRALLIGWLFFVVAVSPTLVNIGYSLGVAADKYVYLPSIGFVIILAWLASRLGGGSSHGRAALGRRGAVLVVAAGLAGAEARATQRYLEHWQDTVSLYKHMLTVAPDSPWPHNGLGGALIKQGKVAEATKHFVRAIRLRPNYAHPYNSLGVALAMQGKLDEAIQHYAEALRLHPGSAQTHNNYGLTLAKLGRLTEATKHYAEALRLRPDYPRAHNNFGVTLMHQGKLDEATQHYVQALRLRPNFAEAYSNLGLALIRQGKFNEAIQRCREALRIAPDQLAGHVHLAMALLETGQNDEAKIHLIRARSLNPSHPIVQRLWNRLTHEGKSGS